MLLFKRYLFLGLTLLSTAQNLFSQEENKQQTKALPNYLLYLSMAVTTSLFYTMRYREIEKYLKSIDIAFTTTLLNAEKYPPLSDKIIELCNQLILEKNLDRSRIKFTSGLGPLLGLPTDDFFVVPLCNEMAALSIPIPKAKRLTYLLDQKQLTLEEIDELDQMIFVIGHELEHMKRYFDGDIWAATRIHKSIGLSDAFCTGSILPLIIKSVYQKEWNKAATYLALTIGIRKLLISIRDIIRYHEEAYADIHASKDPKILNAGINFFSSKYIKSINALCLGHNPIARFINQYSKKWAVAYASHHPHPEVRQEALRKQIEKNRKDAALEGA